MKPFLEQYCAVKGVAFVPIDGFSGENINELTDKAPWYKGGSLFNTLDNITLEKRDTDGALRMPIIDKYKEIG